MSVSPAKNNASVQDTRLPRLARLLLILGWAGWLLAVFSLWLQWRLNVYHPRTWLWLPLAVAGGVASGAAALVGLYQLVRGPRRLAAVGHVFGGGAPLVLWGLLTLYLIYTEKYQGSVFHSHTVRNIGGVAAVDLMTLHASVRYPHCLETERLVMYYGDSVTQPEADAAAMDKHLTRMETLLGKPQHSRIVWVRGSTLGRGPECFRGVAMGSTASPAGILDRHELAHAFLNQFTQPDTNPPTALIEGWAMSQENNGFGLASAAARRRWNNISEKKIDRCLPYLGTPPTYYQPVLDAYYIGGAWVEQLLRRYGSERFLELYNAAQPETFAADCQRILGRSLEDLERDLWEEVYPFNGDLEKAKRTVREELPLGSKRERVIYWVSATLGEGTQLITDLKPWGSRDKTLAQEAGCPDDEVSSCLGFTVILPPADFQGELAENYVFVLILLNPAQEVRGYFFLTYREGMGVGKRD